MKLPTGICAQNVPRFKNENKIQKSSTWQIVIENHLLIMFNKIGFVEIEKSAELEASWQKMKYGERRQISKYQGG